MEFGTEDQKANIDSEGVGSVLGLALGQGLGLEKELGLGGWIIGLKVYSRIVGSNSEVRLGSVAPRDVVVVLLDEAGQELIAGFASQICVQSF